MSALITWLLWGGFAAWLAYFGYALIRDMRRNHRVTHRVERRSSGGER